MSTRAGVFTERASPASTATIWRPSLYTGMTMSSSAVIHLSCPGLTPQVGFTRRAARGDVAIGEAGKIMRGDRKARAREDGADLARQHGALVLGHADRAVERRRAVAVEPHERIHPVGVEGKKAAVRAQQ